MQFFVVFCFARGASCSRLGGERLARKKCREAVGKSDLYPRSGYVQKACRGVTVGRKPTVERIVRMRGNEYLVPLDLRYEKSVIKVALLIGKLNDIARNDCGDAVHAAPRHLVAVWTGAAVFGGKIRHSGNKIEKYSTPVHAGARSSTLI